MRITSTEEVSKDESSASNSASTRMTLGSACSSRRATSPGLWRMLMHTSRAPAAGTAKWASTIAGVFGASTATRSPWSTPSPRSADVRRVTRSFSSR